MGTANSDNAGTNGTLDTFFSVFNPNSGAGTYKNVDILINGVFCVDDFTQTPQIPWVGIAQHGPQFPNSGAIRTLFTRLVQTFPDIWWGESTTAPPQVTAVPRLYSNDGYGTRTVGVQTTLFGHHNAPWFQEEGFSLPLSAIPVNNRPTNIPAFAVFSFGADVPTRVSQLSIYMDRYRQMADLQPQQSKKFNKAVIKFLQDLQAEVESERLTQADLENEAKKPR
jgi:hypothetical protein